MDINVIKWNRIDLCGNLNIPECQTGQSIIGHDLIHINKFSLKNTAAAGAHYKISPVGI